MGSGRGKRRYNAAGFISAYTREGQLGNSSENLLRQRHTEVVLRIQAALCIFGKRNVDTESFICRCYIFWYLNTPVSRI